MIASGTQLSRYTLLELISEHPPAAEDQFPVQLWRGRDEILERSVSIRLIRSEDARISAVLGAAQAAARAEDRRLLRLLDVLSISATFDDPAYTAVISEWSTGKSLSQSLLERGDSPFDSEESLDYVSNVAWALNAALTVNLEHGRLRPSCVFITESREIAIRGLAVDYALFGPLFPREKSVDTQDGVRRDVDGLGSLLYCFSTGLWPYPVNSVDHPAPLPIPFTPKAGKDVPLPSSIKAGIPRAIDEVVGRSVIGVHKPRGATRIQDSLGFANAIASAKDYVTPVSSTTVRGPIITTPNTPMTYVKRGIATLVGIAIVVALGFVGSTMLSSDSSSANGDESIDGTGTDAQELLTSPARPFVEVQIDDAEGSIPIIDSRSFDPFGKNGGIDGTEKNKISALAIDGDLVSAWTTKTYPTRTLGNKGGVGLIVDLGESLSVQGVSLSLVGFGTDIQVRVSEDIQADPDLWTKLVSIDNAGPQIDLRAPRPVTGRYVLVWLTGIPPTRNGTKYQGGISDVTVFGTPTTD